MTSDTSDADNGDADVAARIRASFARQTFMTTLGAHITDVARGRVVIEMRARADLCQQHGFTHAGAVTSIADSACGYAALTTMSADAAVLSVEFKINLTAPAVGERMRATGHVVRAGRTLTVCTGEVHAIEGEKETLVAVMQATMMALRERAGMSD